MVSDSTRLPPTIFRVSRLLLEISSLLRPQLACGGPSSAQRAIGLRGRAAARPNPVYRGEAVIVLDTVASVILRCEGFLAVANLAESFGASAFRDRPEGLSVDVMQTGRIAG